MIVRVVEAYEAKPQKRGPYKKRIAGVRSTLWVKEGISVARRSTTLGTSAAAALVIGAAGSQRTRSQLAKNARGILMWRKVELEKAIEKRGSGLKRSRSDREALRKLRDALHVVEELLLAPDGPAAFKFCMRLVQGRKNRIGAD